MCRVGDAGAESLRSLLVSVIVSFMQLVLATVDKGKY